MVVREETTVLQTPSVCGVHTYGGRCFFITILINMNSNKKENTKELPFDIGRLEKMFAKEISLEDFVCTMRKYNYNNSLHCLDKVENVVDLQAITNGIYWLNQLTEALDQ